MKKFKVKFYNSHHVFWRVSSLNYPAYDGKYSDKFPVRNFAFLNVNYASVTEWCRKPFPENGFFAGHDFFDEGNDFAVQPL